jgi:hypothetical protein
VRCARVPAGAGLGLGDVPVSVVSRRLGYWELGFSLWRWLSRVVVDWGKEHLWGSDLPVWAEQHCVGRYEGFDRGGGHILGCEEGEDRFGGFGFAY